MIRCWPRNLVVIAVFFLAATVLLPLFPGSGEAAEASTDVGSEAGTEVGSEASTEADSEASTESDSLVLIEAGVDLETKQRRMYHQKTGGYGITQEITDYSIFGKGRVGDSWKFRVGITQQDWQLLGPDSQSRIDATVTHFKPRVEYEDDGLKVRGTLLVSVVKEGSSEYTASGTDENFLMPGVDVTVARKELRFLVGGWRELDLYAYPDTTYTPVLYQTVYMGLRYVASERFEYGGKLSLTTREFPSELSQKRFETEAFSKISNPLDSPGAAIWRELSFRLAHWKYDINNEDTLFLSMKNNFRFQSGSVSHDLQHRLTATDVYVVYNESGAADSMVEVDEKGFDLEQRVDYTAWGRIRDTALYWRAGGRLDHSLNRQVYREWRIKAGLSLTF